MSETRTSTTTTRIPALGEDYRAWFQEPTSPPARPKIPEDKPLALPAVTESYVEATLQATDVFEPCTKQWVPKVPMVFEQTYLVFTIQPDGSVKEAEAYSQVPHPKVNACLVSKLKTTNFGPNREKGDTEIFYPIRVIQASSLKKAFELLSGVKNSTLYIGR